MKLNQQPSRAWRWLTLFTVIAAFLLNFKAASWVDAGSASFFRPAEYSYLIWIVIYLALIAYSVFQLRESQRDELLFDRLAKPLILSNLIAIGFSLLSTSTIWSEMLIIGMLVTATILFIIVRDSVLRGDVSHWISVPFSLYAAWLSVTMVSQTSELLIRVGFQDTIMGQVVWTMVMLVGIAFLGTLVCYRCRDYAFPLTISWACVGIFVYGPSESPILGVVALVCATLPLVWIATTLGLRISYRHRVWANKLSF